MADAKNVALEALEAFNAHDEARIRATYAKEVTLEAPGDVHLKGADAATAYAMSWLNAFPDAKMTVHDTVVGEDLIVQRFTFKGTHGDTLRGPTGDIAATHRRLEGRGMQLFRVRGDKITEEHLYFDQMQIVTQLGLISEVASATV
jgi:steroid delta-isomerase-like uncharacterized protein